MFCVRDLLSFMDVKTSFPVVCGLFLKCFSYLVRNLRKITCHGYQIVVIKLEQVFSGRLSQLGCFENRIFYYSINKWKKEKIIKHCRFLNWNNGFIYIFFIFSIVVMQFFIFKFLSECYFNVTEVRYCSSKMCIVKVHKTCRRLLIFE